MFEIANDKYEEFMEESRKGGLKEALKRIEDRKNKKLGGKVKMWKCKNCGEIGEFSERITGGSQRNSYDENGELLQVLEQDIEYGKLSCDGCGHFILDENDIMLIADWVEE